MSMPDCIFKILLIHSFVMHTLAYADSDSSLESRDLKRYQAIIDETEVETDKKKGIELIASGTAATFVGVYGYYFDDRGLIAKIAYAGTQTAGVFVIGQGIKLLNSRNLTLDIAKKIDQATDSSTEAEKSTRSSIRSSIKASIVECQRANVRASQKADAWTAGLLGTLYAYNAFRSDNGDSSIRNIYLFLSANALAFSGYNTWQLFHDADLPGEQLTLGVGLNRVSISYSWH